MCEPLLTWREVAGCGKGSWAAWIKFLRRWPRSRSRSSSQWGSRCRSGKAPKFGKGPQWGTETFCFFNGVSSSDDSRLMGVWAAGLSKVWPGKSMESEGMHSPPNWGIHWSRVVRCQCHCQEAVWLFAHTFWLLLSLWKEQICRKTLNPRSSRVSVHTWRTFTVRCQVYKSTHLLRSLCQFSADTGLQHWCHCNLQQLSCFQSCHNGIPQLSTVFRFTRLGSSSLYMLTSETGNFFCTLLILKVIRTNCLWHTSWSLIEATCLRSWILLALFDNRVLPSICSRTVTTGGIIGQHSHLSFGNAQIL